MQVDDDLVLRAASGVEAGEREREPRLRLERVVAARAGGGDGLAQAADPRVDGAGAHRRLAGLELRPRVRAGADVARRRAGRDRADAGPGGAAELAAQQRVEGVVLALGAVDVAGRGERADEDRLRVLVERVDRDEARGVVGGGVGRGGGEARARGLGEHGLGGGLQVAALVRQPHVERRARREVHALEEVAPEARRAGGVGPVAGEDGVDVDVRARRQGERDRRPAQRTRQPEQAAQLAEVPAQGAERVVCVGEQQRGEALARHRPALRQQMGEERPGLAPPRRRRVLAVAGDGRRAEQMDAEIPHDATVGGRRRAVGAVFTTGARRVPAPGGRCG